MSVARSAANVALTLAVPQADALLLQEAQTLGARPFVMLLPGAAPGVALRLQDYGLASGLA